MKDNFFRLLVKDMVISVFAWLFVFYFYYMIVVWPYGLHFENNEVTEYLKGGYSHLENTLQAILFGIGFSIINVTIENSKLRQKPYWLIIAIKSLLYVITLTIATSIIIFLFEVTGIWPIEKYQEMRPFLKSKLVVSVLMYLVFFVMLYNLTIQVSRKFGPGILWKLIIGKYHSPREEHRTFLFLDLQSSTSHAESMGNKRYSSFLKQCFHDLNDVAIQLNAHIYQYVGDEAVITWLTKEENARNNGLRFFDLFEKRLQQKTKVYEKRFNVNPVFKGGIDSGAVIATEIGDIKREIAYHGDVLNTAARLQQLASKENHRLLISAHALDHYKRIGAFTSMHAFHKIGKVQLRGKTELLDIFEFTLKGKDQKPIDTLEAISK